MPDNFNIQQNIKIKNIPFDIVAFSKSKDFLYEVKYWESFPTTNQFNEIITKFENKCKMYKEVTNKDYKSFFIILTSNYIDLEKHLNQYIQKNKTNINIRIIEYMSISINNN